VFAESLCRILRQWDMTVLRQEEEEPLSILRSGGVDLVLLDIRQQLDEALLLLRSIRRELPELEVIVINRPDNVRASLAGMQAGAVDEIIAPCDTGLLRRKITEAWKRRQARLKKKKKRSVLGMFSEAMAAATFAQAGEFETAVEFLRGGDPAEKKEHPKDREQDKDDGQGRDTAPGAGGKREKL
jgi:DNA-binding NtrC family response regulator